MSIKHITLLVCLLTACVGIFIYRDIATAWSRYQPAKPGTPSILLVWGRGTGEQEFAQRFKIAAERLGIYCKQISWLNQSSYVITKWYGNVTLFAAAHMQPDLILTIERDIPPIGTVPNYLVLDQSKYNYLVKNDLGKLVLLNPQHYEFTALLPVFPEIDLLQRAVTANGQEYYGFPWYYTSYKTDYTPQYPKHLFYAGGVLSDPTRKSDKYKEFFSMLDAKGYLEVYGQTDKWQHTPNSIRGPIPFDGVSVLKLSNQAGVTLILHQQDHLLGGLPTGRIFEAVAANTVIIADQNKFLQQHFGDNVLYIDVKQNAAEIFAQIDAHMQWIYAHPQEAMQMAQRCHDVFMREFALEDQIVRLVELNSRLVTSMH